MYYNIYDILRNRLYIDYRLFNFYYSRYRLINESI